MPEFNNGKFPVPIRFCVPKDPNDPKDPKEPNEFKDPKLFLLVMLPIPPRPVRLEREFKRFPLTIKGVAKFPD